MVVSVSCRDLVCVCNVIRLTTAPARRATHDRSRLAQDAEMMFLQGLLTRDDLLQLKRVRRSALLPP
jgi:hypothetical protein